MPFDASGGCELRSCPTVGTGVVSDTSMPRLYRTRIPTAARACYTHAVSKIEKASARGQHDEVLSSAVQLRFAREALLGGRALCANGNFEHTNGDEHDAKTLRDVESIGMALWAPSFSHRKLVTVYWTAFDALVKPLLPRLRKLAGKK